MTARGVAHLVVHGTTGSTSYETIPPVRLESSEGVLSTVDMVVQRRYGPRRLRDHDDDDDDDEIECRRILRSLGSDRERKREIYSPQVIIQTRVWYEIRLKLARRRCRFFVFR